MTNPRKRKAIKDGRMEKMIEQRKIANKQVQQPATIEKQKLLFDEPVIKDENATKEKAIDPFIAKELEEIKRIPSSKKKTANKVITKKKTTAKKATKKTTTKKKTGDK